VFSIDVLEKTAKGWEPAKLKDAQFEAVMLDPYTRVPLKPTNKATQVAKFTLPDQHGVFTFKFEYSRRGLSFIKHVETVQVRPFRHDQYPRFLVVAAPYYVASASMMVSFVVFSALFLYHRDTTKVKKS
jgi:oligosaccharyltransferase complex subunit beta